MGTIVQKLNKLEQTKAAIKAAIEAKGVSNVGDKFSDYPSKIASITSGGGTSDLDFTKIGYKNTPSYITDGLAYAEKILSEWDENAPAQSFLRGDENIIFMPSLKLNSAGEIDKSFQNLTNLQAIGDMYFPNITSTHQCFSGSNEVISIGKLLFPSSKYCREMFYKPKLEKIEYLDVSMASGLSSTFIKLDVLRYMELKFGYNPDFNSIDLSLAPLWGVNDEHYPNAEEAMKRSLIINSCDRLKAGMSVATISLAPKTKALLTQDEIAQITAKGYTIA